MSFANSPLASPEWAGFVWSMRIFPDDDTIRLIAADWLQEHGLPELTAWAEFVRYQVEAARVKRDHVYTDSCDCGACRPERRAVVLFDQWGYHWAAHTFAENTWADVNVALNPVASDYHRGFLIRSTAEFYAYRVANVPRQFAPLLTRQPVANVILQLRKATYAPVSRVSLADYVTCIRFRPSAVIEESIGVNGLIRKPPDLTSEITAYRRAETPQQLPRMIRAVTADLLRKRWMLAGLATPPIRDTGRLRPSLGALLLEFGRDSQ